MITITLASLLGFQTLVHKLTTNNIPAKINFTTKTAEISTLHFDKLFK